MMSGRSSSRFPFTANQWQELEHQALIFKYMVSGIPIPHDLLFTIKRTSSSSPSSSFLDSSSKLFPSQTPHIGWSCFQLGLGRKIDPEPGRCRRTDGKKWRCSKEAYPDSKYCERHMHRGKNRSRKPVEAQQSTPKNLSPSPTPTFGSSSANAHTSLSLLSPSSSSSDYPHGDYNHNHNHNLSHQFLSSFHSSRQQQQQPHDSTSLLLDSAGYYRFDNNHTSLNDLTNYRRSNEREFFTETSGSMRRTSSYLDSNPSDQSAIRGFEFDRGDEPQKTVHRFFDEWPPMKNKESSSTWLDLDDKSSNNTTRLSISIPNSASLEFPIFGSRMYHQH
ncbi:Growth-regulating factor 5 [Linum perenne]